MKFLIFSAVIFLSVGISWADCGSQQQLLNDRLALAKILLYQQANNIIEQTSSPSSSMKEKEDIINDYLKDSLSTNALSQAFVSFDQVPPEKKTLFKTWLYQGQTGFGPEACVSYQLSGGQPFCRCKPRDRSPASIITRFISGLVPIEGSSNQQQVVIYGVI